MKNVTRVAFLLVVLFLATFPSVAQISGGITQSGNVTVNNCVKWGPGAGQVQDAGLTCGGGGSGNANFGTATGNVAGDVVTMANTTVGIQDSGVSITAIPNANVAATPFATGSSTGNTLTAPRGYFVCTSTCTVTPPVPAAGYEFCVMNDDNVNTVITLGAIGSSSYYENTARTAYGTAGTGTLSSAGAKGDMICIVGRDSTHYLSTTYVGTWTAS